MSENTKTTPCGAKFRHATHLFRTKRGYAKAYDGVFREDKVAGRVPTLASI